MKRITILPCVLLASACQLRAPGPAAPFPSGPASRPIVLPDDPPIWEVFRTLECRGMRYLQCFHPRGSCENDRSTAHIRVDFDAQAVTWIEGSGRERIQGRTFRRGFTDRGTHVLSQSTIYLSDPSKAIDFGGSVIAAEEERDPGTLPATMTHTTGYTTFIHRMRCRPIAGR